MNVLRFPLSIQVSSTRPIFPAIICDKEILCLLDTGAQTPIYCRGDKLFNIFIHDLPGVKPYGKIPVGGFGAGTERASVYNFDNFSISDTNTVINYKNCKVAVLDKKTLPCDLVLPISLFLKSKVLLDYVSNERQLTIGFDRDEYGVGYYASKGTVYTLTQ